MSASELLKKLEAGDPVVSVLNHVDEVLSRSDRVAILDTVWRLYRRNELNLILMSKDEFELMFGDLLSDEVEQVFDGMQTAKFPSTEDEMLKFLKDK